MSNFLPEAKYLLALFCLQCHTKNLEPNSLNQKPKIKSPTPKTSDVPESILSSQSHKPFESEPSKIVRLQSESSHDLVKSSQNRVTITVESLVCKLESMSNLMKFHIFL